MEHHFLVEKTLANRKISKEFLDSRNMVVHEEMLGSSELCSILHGVCERGDCITFIPDYDMDGIMAGTIGFAGLSELGFNVRLFIPDPADGYGFTEATIRRLLDKYPETRFIMTGDVGITCYDGVDAANAAGVRVLVTDHHLEKNGMLNAECVVDPMRKADPYYFPQICGAAVVYKCLQLYADTYCSRFVSEQIRRLRVFAGIGTVSDSMPVLKENRVLVRDAISICRLFYFEGSDSAVNYVGGSDQYRRAFYGLYAVMKAFCDHGKLRSSRGIDEMFFGYYMAPMFNSVKRMTGDMSRAFGVFFGARPEEDVEYLYDMNLRRKELVADCMAQLKAAEPSGMEPYVYVTDAPAGVLGLMAQNLMSESGRPVIVVRDCGDGVFSGSGRSPVWYPMITRTERLGLNFGGHEGAFGVTLYGSSELKTLFQFLFDDVDRVMSTVDSDDLVWTPDFVIDHEGNGDTVIDIMAFLEYLSEFSRFRPFGRGFPEPDILLRFHSGDGEWSTIGSENQHLKIRLQRGLDVLLWNQGHQKPVYEMREVCLVRGRLETSVFQDRRTVQFVGRFVSEGAVV